MRREYADDCIHLKACRRYSRIIEDKIGKNIPRNCANQCSAYISNADGKYVTVEDAVEYALDGSDSIRSGYDEYDVYAPQDFDNKCMTIGDIIEKLSGK